MPLLRLGLACALCSVAGVASAQRAVRPWEGLGENLEAIYGWPGVLVHVAAAASTPPLVYTVDRPVQDYFQQDDPVDDPLGENALLIGGFAPVLVPAGLYLATLDGGDPELASAAAAVSQAEVVQFVAVTLLKWLTDRAGPFPDGDANAKRWTAGLTRDSSDPTDFNFNPFDLSGGLRWPSGHTASNVAMISALVAFYPEERWLPWVGYPYAALVGVGMLEGDYHWVSDVVAGALIGHVIGWVIGKHFRGRYERSLSQQGALPAEQELREATPQVVFRGVF